MHSDWLMTIHIIFFFEKILGILSISWKKNFIFFPLTNAYTYTVTWKRDVDDTNMREIILHCIRISDYPRPLAIYRLSIWGHLWCLKKFVPSSSINRSLTSNLICIHEWPNEWFVDPWANFNLICRNESIVLFNQAQNLGRSIDWFFFFFFSNSSSPYWIPINCFFFCSIDFLRQWNTYLSIYGWVKLFSYLYMCTLG